MLSERRDTQSSVGGTLSSYYSNDHIKPDSAAQGMSVLQREIMTEFSAGFSRNDMEL